MSRKREDGDDHSESQNHHGPKRSRPPRQARTTPTVPIESPHFSELQQHQHNADQSSGTSSSLVIVSGLLPNCTVLQLKSRFQLFGSISRLRIDQALGLGYITFRSTDSAEAAIAAALDPLYGISINSTKVQVSWATDPLPQWKVGVGVASNKERPSSKLLRAEIPLSRHGRGSRRAGSSVATSRNELDSSFKGREIVAYDDIL